MSKEARGSDKARENTGELRELSNTEIEQIAGGLKLVRWFPNGTPHPFYRLNDINQMVNPSIADGVMSGQILTR